MRKKEQSSGFNDGGVRTGASSEREFTSMSAPAFLQEMTPEGGNGYAVGRRCQRTNNSGGSKESSEKKRNVAVACYVASALIIVVDFSICSDARTGHGFSSYEPWLGFFAFSLPLVSSIFKTMFEYEDARQVIWNTLVISTLKIIFNLGVPLAFALLLNEVYVMKFKRTVQTIVYLPHFLSWVILGGILIDMLSPEGGIVNRFLSIFGVKPIFFLGDNDWFRTVVVVTDVWKECGFNTIVFLAALTSIKGSLYEAAIVDGANRWQQTIYISLPSMLPIIIVVGTLSLGNILNAGFDQILNLYNPLVYKTGDIIDTYVYRVGLLNGDFSYATAVGLFKSVISFILVVTGYRLAYKYANYKIF
uniref:Sugar abc transport system permease component n=1 Tax=Geobacillus stearothermophilus TaxID=1422 RepID=Q09LY7_GEOSE|nr:sugar abc transport system permease component [Geobacillus stearothermophilus]